MASSYSTLANSGTHIKPYLVEKVTKEGEDDKETTVEEHKQEGTEVLSEDEAAAAVTQTLRGVVERGTAGRYRNLDAEIGRPSAGKTGTTELFVDAWYIGYVPQLATSIWVGYPTERAPMINIRGFPEINGENFPLDIWSLYTQEVAKSLPVEELNSPSSGLELRVKKSGRAVEKPNTAKRRLPRRPGNPRPRQPPGKRSNRPTSKHSRRHHATVSRNRHYRSTGHRRSTDHLSSRFTDDRSLLPTMTFRKFDLAALVPD